MRFYSAGKYIPGDYDVSYTPSEKEKDAESTCSRQQSSWNSQASQKALATWKKKQAEKEERIRREDLEIQTKLNQEKRHLAHKREQMMSAKPWRTEDFIPLYQYGQHTPIYNPDFCPGLGPKSVEDHPVSGNPDIRKLCNMKVKSNFDTIRNSTKKGANFRSGRDGSLPVSPY
eukprot:TRINITY_DN31951_c0_g1_i1.p1 TRINITY_DN31951_c0_g1~~TRINITY_DN31951_c0_g1_i1.p1  ORF type:complete len:190 (+),score=23.42 TRINITY_DN31951_c0_g1_i1:53-571(+)